MARLIGLPDTLEQLMYTWESDSCPWPHRFGQWVWNRYGVHGVDGKSLEKNGVQLFYASHEQAVEMMREYYSK